MKLIHTADLHLGQIIYQSYDRSDEHNHFFMQLEEWCRQEQPDALLISGDVFDIQQPSATVKKTFTDFFVGLHRHCPNMHIVITAGNHDSASRIQADRAVWQLANTHMIGLPPAIDLKESDSDWQSQYIIKLDSGYIIALPYMIGERERLLQSILDKVADDNKLGLPVVMMAHQAVTGLDIQGHDFEIGTLKTQSIDSFGSGFDYLALGHIHKPQTISHQEDAMQEEVCYPAPVVRYSGSALHVSCDEIYPHSVSLVELDKHEGNIKIKQLRINELRHFYILPINGESFTSVETALDALKVFVEDRERGYIRFRFDHKTDVPSNFSQQVYDLLTPYKEEWRFNPKIIWTGNTEVSETAKEKLVFEVAELQQMTDPMAFIEKTKDQYPTLDLEDVRQAFEDVKAEIHRLNERKENQNR